jgi:NarL family two-component system response regulator LiaR
MTTPIRVLIVDDHAIVRKGIVALLAHEPDLRVVGEAADGEAAVTQAAILTPDVILMDLVMPEGDGIAAIRRIVAEQPAVRILVLTSFATDEKIFPAVKAGALGYLLKDSTPEELVRAIRQVAHGEASLHPMIARKILHELAHPPEHPPPAQTLSERELDVLRLVTQGLSNREIAERLVITEMTVRSHVSNILSKLHLASRIQAALYALREGIVGLDEH